MDPGTAQTAHDIENTWRFIGQLWRAGSSTPSGHVALEVWRIDLLRQVYVLWFQAPNWATLVGLNRRYLEGRLPSCASEHKPTNFDAAYVNSLLRLHEYGLVTTVSCPGMRQDLEWKRAFLYFSIPTGPALAILPGTTRPNVLRQFILGLFNCGMIRVHIRYQYSTNRPHPPEIMQLLHPHEMCDTLPDRQDPAWQREAWWEELDDTGRQIGLSFPQHATRADIGQEEWDVHAQSGGYVINVYGSYFADDEPGGLLRASAEADPLQISAVATNWNFTGIPHLIEQLLLNAGVVRGPDFAP